MTKLDKLKQLHEEIKSIAKNITNKEIIECLNNKNEHFCKKLLERTKNVKRSA